MNTNIITNKDDKVFDKLDKYSAGLEYINIQIARTKNLVADLQKDTTRKRNATDNIIKKIPPRNP